MALQASTVIKGDAAEITLAGELDAASAPALQRELETAAAAKPKHLVLRMRDLSYMASAGVRMLIFARQKMGAGVTVHVVAPQEPVLDTIRRTGLHTSVSIQDEYPA
jgi:anti-anti-sigma factor